MAWVDVEARLKDAIRVWLATVRPDGPPHGSASPAGAFAGAVWRFRPAKVMAWTSLPADATRSRFDG